MWAHERDVRGEATGWCKKRRCVPCSQVRHAHSGWGVCRTVTTAVPQPERFNFLIGGWLVQGAINLPSVPGAMFTILVKATICPSRPRQRKSGLFTPTTTARGAPCPKRDVRVQQERLVLTANNRCRVLGYPFLRRRDTSGERDDVRCRALGVR